MSSLSSGTNGAILPQKVPRYSLKKGISFGAIGGLIAGLIMAGIGYEIPVPGMMGDPFFISTADMWKMSDKIVVGWSLHIVTSLAIGVLFGVITARITILRVTGFPKGLVLGAVTGLATFILVFLPVEIPPMPGLVSATNFMIESFGYNLVYGLVLGVIVSGLTLMTQGPKTNRAK